MDKRLQASIIRRIAIRAVQMATSLGHDYKLSDAIMDITCAHEFIPLRLAELANADDFNFAHDVFGINRHLDHDTLKLNDCFIPRYAA